MLNAPTIAAACFRLRAFALQRPPIVHKEYKTKLALRHSAGCEITVRSLALYL
jgi:hypothetical protein